MSLPEKTLEYKYSDKIWTPHPTFGEGGCFFHAIFGEEVKHDGELIYFDKQVHFRRHCWCCFLLYYLQDEIPEPLLEIFRKCFFANDSFHERSPQNQDDFREYIRDLMTERCWVLVEEIPILAALWNVKVVLFLNDQENPTIIEPNLQISGTFPFKNVNPLQEKVVRLVDNHYEKLIAISEANETTVLDRRSSQKGNSGSFCFDEDIDDTIYSDKKNYNKAGSAGVQGGLYQVTLLSLVLLNALEKVQKWVLSTENPYAGKFDDLVFESENGAVLVQAKHKEGTNVITYDALLSVGLNANFSLAKYYFSYQKIKTKFDIEKIVICTNAKLKIGEELVDRHTIDEDGLLHFKATCNQYYSFNENIIPDLATAIKTFHKENKVETEECFSEDCIKEFLGLLQFFDRFMEDEMIDSVIGALIPSISLARNLDSKDTFASVHKVMLKWFKERKGRYLSHLDAKAVFCDIRTSKYCDTLQNYEISFNEDHLLDRFREIQILHTIPCVKPTLNVLKLYQSLIRDPSVLSLMVNPQDDTFIQLQAVNVFSLPRYKFLVISCPIKANDEIIRQMCEKLTSILNKYKSKILILIADANDEIVEQIRVRNEDRYRQIFEDIHFEDLHGDCQKDFRTKRNIRFQGIDMTLDELVPDVNDFVDAEVLETLARNDRIQIGTEMKHTDDDLNTYYILRNLKRHTENISEDDIRQIENLDERVVLISDSAGMGKTTILANLAIWIKTDYPSLWVVRIDLNNCASSFKNALRTQVKSISIIDLLNDQDNTKLDSKLSEKLFFKERNVVLLLDAVDEVSPGYMTLVMGMISDAKLQKNYAKIFITTRPHLCGELEEKLKVSAYSLEPFSKRNQEDFLTNYWTGKLNLRDETDKERCRQYACALIQEMSRWIHDSAKDAFAGIPLQTRMLAEVFQEKNRLDEGETNEWEECNEFISSDRDSPQLPKTINLIQLYNLFIKKKRDIFVDDKGNTGGNAVAQKALMDKFEECHMYHRSFALSSLFYSDDCSLFRCFKVMDWSESFILDYLLPVGIMQIVDRNFCFIHRTFAEYFAAQSIMFELKQGDISESFGEFFLEEILIRKEFHVVRAFFDSFIQKELGSVPKSTFMAFSEVDYLSVLSRSWKSYLHLFAQDGLVGVMEFFMACINFAVTGETEIGEEKIILATATDMKGNTPLHEACYWGHLNVIKSLIEHGADVNYENVHGETPLHKAVYNGHFEITEFLVDQAGANLAQENVYRENALLVAVQRNHFKLAKFLINLNVPHTGTYTTALHLACYNGQLDFVRYLVEDVRIGIESRDVNDCTPLHAAAHKGHLNVIKYLVGKGCNVNAVHGEGNAAFHDAALWGYREVVRFLCENGADTELVGELGFNILQLEAWMLEEVDCEGAEK